MTLKSNIETLKTNLTEALIDLCIGANQISDLYYKSGNVQLMDLANLAHERLYRAQALLEEELNENPLFWKDWKENDGH